MLPGPTGEQHVAYLKRPEVSASDTKLAELGIELPAVVAPLAAYVPAVRTGNLVYTVGPAADASAASWQAAARSAPRSAPKEAQGAGAHLRAQRAGRRRMRWSASTRWSGWSRSSGSSRRRPASPASPALINGASELLGEVFGDAGAHARSAVGVSELPLDAPVEVELIVEVRAVSRAAMTLTIPPTGSCGAVTDTASVLLCNNPGLMTLDGTNTWVLQGPGSDELVIVDPGPDDDEHIDRIAALGKIPLVLISHRHGDHTGAIDKLVDRTGRRVRAVGSGFLRGLGGPLSDGEVIDAAGPAHHGDGDARAHRGLVVVPGRRRGERSDGTAGADRGHGARPRHHRHRQRGRQPRATTWSRCGACTVSAGDAVLPGHGPDLPRPGGRRRRCTWRTASSGSTRCARRYASSATTPPHGRSSSTSTPTSTRSCGIAAEWSVQAQLNYLRA